MMHDPIPAFLWSTYTMRHYTPIPLYIHEALVHSVHRFFLRFFVRQVAALALATEQLGHPFGGPGTRDPVPPSHQCGPSRVG